MTLFNLSSPFRGIRGGLFLFLLPLFALTLISCGDEEGDIPDPYQKTKYYLHYWFEPSADFSTYYDFTAKYVNFDGDTITTTVSDKAPLNVEYQAPIKDVPNVQYGCIVTATLKSGINVDAIADDLKADFLCKYEMEASKMDNNGERYPFAITSSKHIDPYTGDLVLELGVKNAPVKNYLIASPKKVMISFLNK